MKTQIKTPLIIIFLLQVLFSFSQTWPKYYGEPNRYDFPKDIIENYDKGYLICGNYSVYTDKETNKWTWLIKTNTNGEVVWEKIIENDEHFVHSVAVEQTSDGGLLVCGLAYVNANTSYPYVIKFNSCMEKVWCKHFQTSEDNSWAQDIKETQTGDIIVLVNQFDEGPEETMHLFKLNSEGDVIWKKAFCSGYEYPEAALPLGRSLNISSQNEYLISGSVYWEEPWSPGGTKVLRPLFVMVDSLGIEKWVLPFGLSDTIYGTAENIVEINNDYFVGIGSYWTNQVYVEPLFMKFDQNGNELEHQILYTSQITPELVGGSFIKSLMINSIFYSGGGFIFPDNLGYPIMEAKLHFDSINFNFTPLQNKIYYENSDPYTLDKTINNKLLSNSTFKETGNWDIALSKLNLNLEYDTLDPGNYTYDSLCTTPGLPQSGFIYLDDCELITGIDVPSPEQYYAHLKTIPLSVYPNPANKIVNFAMENTGHHKNIALKCFDLMGKKVFESPVITGQKETSAVISHWPNGMYVAVVYSEGLPVGECKFVVE